MTTKETLHHIIDQLSEKEAQDLLDWLNLQADPDELTSEEKADLARIRAAGDYVSYESVEDLRRHLGLPLRE